MRIWFPDYHFTILRKAVQFKSACVIIFLIVWKYLIWQPDSYQASESEYLFVDGLIAKPVIDSCTLHQRNGGYPHR